MATFIERLQQAAKHAGVGESQAAISSSPGLARQPVTRWFMGGEPNAEQTFRIARAWGVDAEWLKSGVGTMLQPPSDGLSTEERDLIKNYRSATPSVRDVIRIMTRAARKSMVTVAMAIPPLMAPQPVDAATSATLHNALHIVLRRWLSQLLPRRSIMIS